MKTLTFNTSILISAIGFALSGLMVFIPMQTNAAVRCTVSVLDPTAAGSRPDISTNVAFADQTACETSTRSKNEGKTIRCQCVTSTAGPGMDTFKPLGDTSVQKIIGKIINYVLGLTGVVALVMFVYGGMLWMTAAGSDEKIVKAKNTLTWAVIGLIAIFASYQLVDTILSSLGQ